MVRIDTLSGNLKIYQPDEGQRYSTDDLMTAWMTITCCGDNQQQRFLDLGSGLCSVPMIVMWKFRNISGVGIELRENRRELGLKSLELNGLSERFELLSGDLRDLNLDEKFQLITSTPPYYKGFEGPRSPHNDKAAARFELNGSIDDYFSVAQKHLTNDGMFITVYPFAYRDRVYEAASLYGMSSAQRIDVIPREGKVPLISLFAMNYSTINEAISTITIRNSSGGFTKEYNKARILCGFSWV